jgi:NADH:ubiquinone oxidoreductase subunit 4 (subunit M)
MAALVAVIIAVGIYPATFVEVLETAVTPLAGLGG